MIIRYDKCAVLTSEWKTSYQWFYRMQLAYICPCVFTLCWSLHSALVERLEYDPGTPDRFCMGFIFCVKN